MATRKAESAEQLKKRWEAREAFLARQTPKTFVGACAKILQTCISVLGEMVYSGGKGYQSHTLRRGEILARVSDVEMLIRNVAASLDGYKYGVIVHEGHPGKNAPTGGGKQYWAWVDPPHPRPTDSSGWKVALAEGWGHMSKRFAPRTARKWREVAIDRSHDEMPKAFENLHTQTFWQGP